jgi:HEAT repeat protein
MPIARSPAGTMTLDQLPRTQTDLLIALSSGASEANRRDAALDLAQEMTNGADVVPALGAALRTETAPRVREAIVTALVGIRTDAAAGVLADFLGSEDVALRNAAVEGLQLIGKAAAAQLKPRLASPDPDVRVLAITALEALKHDDAPGWLRDVLIHDPEVTVGLAAVQALARIGGPDDAPALHAFAARFPGEPFVEFVVDLACRNVIPSHSG